MQCFLRLLRSSLRYRWTIAGIFFSSLLVALMWGLNIGALFPVLKVALSDRPLQEWIQDEIQEAGRNVTALRNELTELPGDARRERRRLESRIATEQDAAKFYGKMAVAADYLPRDPFQTIVVIVCFLVAGTAVKGIFIFCNLILVARLEQRVTFDLRQKFFHQCLRFDHSLFGEHRTSGLISRFHADIACVSNAVTAIAGAALREPLKMLACLVGASLISWRLLLLSLILTPITAITIRKLAGAIKRANRRSLEEVTTLYAVLTEAFQGIETVHAYSLERNQRQRFFQVAKACFQKTMRIALYNALTKPITELLGIVAIAVALISGAYLTLNEALYIGPIRMLDRPLDMTSMLAFFSFLIGATEPARKLSDVFNSVQAGTAAAERLVPMLNAIPQIRDAPQPDAVVGPIRKIEFDHVTFHYEEGTTVLDDVSLEIQAGETIAIVGPNGCGKTSLINMLPRFHDPVDGSVRVNGIPLRELRLKDVRQRIGLVTQRSLLFDDTVRTNIRHGRLDASEAEILRAAQRARAHRFITDKLSRGYDTVIGTAGSNLSGGQRQRIALARAMVRDPEILILDEATSQIDIESEQLIHQALEQFSKDRTVILVTHRLATLELADRIVVMDHGRIIATGTHRSLLQHCDVYRRLHDVQFKRTA